MGLKVEIKEQDAYMELKFIGKYSFDKLKELSEQCIQEVERLNKDKVLGDISEMTGEILDFDRFELGVHLAKRWGAIKIAIMDRPQDNTHFAENVAVNRGAKVVAFLDRDKALRWLLDV